MNQHLPNSYDTACSCADQHPPPDVSPDSPPNAPRSTRRQPRTPPQAAGGKQVTREINGAGLLPTSTPLIYENNERRPSLLPRFREKLLMFEQRAKQAATVLDSPPPDLVPSA